MKFNIKFFQQKNAIKDLQGQLHQINALTLFDFDTYKTITARIVKKYFGETSDLYNQISKFDFSDFSTLPEELRDANIEGKRALKKVEAITFIETCLLVVLKDGIVQKNRIFMPDAVELIRKYSLWGPFLTAMFFWGKWVESNSIHDEFEAIEIKCDSLAKSNAILTERIDSLNICCEE